MSNKTIVVECICGKEFETTENRIAEGRGKYCSKKCLYKYRTRPTGLKYTLHKINPTSYKKGHIPYFTGTKGLRTAWNKGIKGIHQSPETEFRYKNGNGYRHLIEKGILPCRCSICEETDFYKLEVHHVDRNRKNNNLDNFEVLCRYHHLQKHDKVMRTYV